MSSDFISSPSVLPGASTPLPICDASGPLGTPPSQPRQSQHFRSPSRMHSRPRGHVYSLSGQDTAPSKLGHSPLGPSPGSHQQALSFVPYGVDMVQRCHKIQKSRALPYQKGPLDQFLSLEKDAEHLMQMLKAQIRQA